jgi:hypothetical protein
MTEDLEFDSLQGQDNFSSLYSIQTSYVTASLGLKQSGHKAEHSCPLNAEVKNTWRCISVLSFTNLA